MALVHFRKSNAAADALAAYAIIRDLTDSYPGFDDWFFRKALPDIEAGRGSMILAEQDSQIVGVVLGKRTPEETKLRCIRVVPRMRGRGLGLSLIDRMLADLDCAKPVVTVPQDLLHDYSRPFVNRYGFALTEVAKGLYRPGRLEYVFNGGR